MGVNCTEVDEEPGRIDNTWGAWGYQDDYGDQSWVELGGATSPNRFGT